MSRRDIYSFGNTCSALGGGGPDIAYVFVNAEASALVARMTSPPTNARKLLIDNAFTPLKVGPVSGSNILAKLDNLHVIAAHDEQAGQRNWITDARNLTPQNSPTFTVDRGYSGDGVSQHVTWNGAIFTDGGQYVQDSACLFSWETSDVNDSTVALAQTGSGASQFTRGRNAGNAEGRANDATTLVVAQASSLGLTLVNRSGATAKQLYRNGASIGSSATVSSATGMAGVVALLRNNTAYSTRRIGACGKGSSLTANENLDLYNALNTYMVAVGAA